MTDAVTHLETCPARTGLPCTCGGKKAPDDVAAFDWSPFDKYSHNTCYCRCGTVFRAHSRFFKDYGLVTRTPCPGCGKNSDVRRASSDPETFTIGKKE